MTQLPAYLTQIPASGLAARAVEGIGDSPPHISIKSNRFKLVDASGAEQMVESLYLDVCVADVSDVMCKMFYEADYQEGQSEPPTCWSANGIAPSIEAINPQSDRCDTCEWNKRGSATSMKGKPTKACRDEKYLAVLIPGYQMAFRLVLTPGSFVNWRTYIEKFKGQQFDLCHVLTRLAFDPQQNGVMTFAAQAYIDENLAKTYVQMKAEKKSDLLVGRTDKPRLLAGNTATQGQAALAAPAAQPQGFQPAPFGNAAPAAAATNAQPAGAPNTAQPEPTRRRRRTRAEIEADNAAQGQRPTGEQAQPQGFGVAPGAPNGGPAFGAPAPTNPAAPFAQPATAAPFGIAQNAPPPPAGLDAALDNLFAPAAGGQKS